MSDIEFELQPPKAETSSMDNPSVVVAWVMRRSAGVVQTKKQAVAVVLAVVALALIVSGAIFYKSSAPKQDEQYIDLRTGHGIVPEKDPNIF